MKDSCGGLSHKLLSNDKGFAAWRGPEGSLDLDGLSALDDGQARYILIQVKGIGAWTADIYLLMALRRPDVWPSGDLALATAVQAVKRLPQRPSPDQLEGIGQAWRSWRAVAARVLWHFYLSGGVPRSDLARSPST
jgi:DNA-3-methyladenine glycosylase II